MSDDPFSDPNRSINFEDRPKRLTFPAWRRAFREVYLTMCRFADPLRQVPDRRPAEPGLSGTSGVGSSFRWRRAGWPGEERGCAETLTHLFPSESWDPGVASAWVGKAGLQLSLEKSGVGHGLSALSGNPAKRKPRRAARL